MSLSPEHAQDLLESSRQASEARLAKLPIPTLRDPAYKFTSVSKIDWERLPQRTKEVAYLPCPFRSRSKQEGAVMSLGASSSEAVLDQDADFLSGVDFLPMTDLRARPHPVLERCLASSSSLEEDRFACLAWARWQSGYFLYVPANTQLKKSLRSLFYFDKRSETFFFRNFVVLGENAKLELIDDFESEVLSEKCLAIGSSQIWLSKGAELKYSLYQNWRGDLQHFIRQEVFLSEGAHFQQSQLHLGGRKSQFRQVLHFDGTSAKAQQTWGVKANERQHFDFWVHQNHKARDTNNALDFHGVAAGSSQIVFNGMQKVEPGAQGTDSYHKTKSLILSSRAAVKNLPQLIIAHDDIKIAHGASSSSVDEAQIYYLQSRGLSRSEACEMIIDGFTEKVVESFSSDHLRERMRQEMKRKAFQ